MEKKGNKKVLDQINQLKKIATFNGGWVESPNAFIKNYYYGEDTVSYVSVGVFKEFQELTFNLYNSNEIIQKNYTLENFIREVVGLVLQLYKDQRDANNNDWTTIVDSLLLKPDIEAEIAFPIYGVLLEKDFIEFGNFKIYKREALKNKYSRLTDDKSAFIESDYFLIQTVFAKSLDKCREDAEKVLSSFENVANFIIAGFHKTHKISFSNNWFFSQISHLVFTNNQVLRGGKTLYRFEPIRFENPYFFDAINGYGNIWEILSSANRTKLQNKILESIEWSGKASVETDDNKAFLLYMIAIESILNYSPPNSLYTPITSSLADSVAFLLGKSQKSRIEYAKSITELYRIRSGIVHGSVRKISDLDLHKVFVYSHQIVKKILFEAPYNSFETKEKLCDYLLKEKKYEMGEGTTP